MKDNADNHNYYHS